MAERPIILFGQPQKADKSKRGGGAPVFQRPSHSHQAERLAPKMTALQNAVATIKQSPMGIEAEKTLVFDVIGEADRFYTAVKNLGEDAEWIFDMPQDFDTSEDFYFTKKGEDPNTFVRDTDKAVIGGKVYCVLSNARAMEEMLSLWNNYGCDKDTPFPRGKAGLRDVFDSLENMSFWGYKQRVEETGILEIWKEELSDDSLGDVKCEFELFYRRDSVKRTKGEQELRTEIENLNGSVLGVSTIPEIAYHAVLASVPRNVAENIINGNQNISIATAEQVMFFRPVGQTVVIPKENSFDVGFTVPLTDGISDEPVIALFDGLPQENHPYLQNRLIVDDPDGYSTGYVIDARKHGTAMASLITLGDLSKIEHAASRKIYVRPIMKPTSWMSGDYLEQTPEDSLLVDKILVAVRNLFEGEEGGAAPSIKVVNLSIGLEYRQFDRSMSPLARLIDWLSCKYKVLFVVSAGNHPDSIDTGMPFNSFATVDKSDRDKAVIAHMDTQKRNLRLLSPAESINALTVGSTFEDASAFVENARQILPCSDGIISVSSSVGTGMNSAVKPDIVFPGGRSCVRENFRTPGSTIIDWQDTPTREPGTATAAPGGKVSYTFGTSNSAALMSHEASRCYDTLLEVFSVAEEEVPFDNLALLIKAMLVHGAEWGALTEKYADALKLYNKDGEISHRDCSCWLHRYFGYGRPNIERAIECAKERITLIGYGELKHGEALIYDLPLPFNFSNSKICRRLTATLAYFSPTIPTRQKYRAAQCWLSIENGKKNFLDSRVDVDWQAAVRGSLQHEIFENDDIVIWDETEGIQIKVNCRGDAVEKFDGTIPYALMVSFEIKGAVDIDVYTKIAERIAPKVTV
jgi:hypothetical protein